MTMHLFWFVVGCVLSGVVLLPGTGADLPADGTLSSTILSGPVFYVTGWNTTHADLTNHIIVMVTNEPNGVPLNGPELRVVANTTVYFHITGIVSYSDDYSYPIAFGLTLSSNTTSGTPVAGDALGLTPTPASVSAGACYSYLAKDPAGTLGPSQQGRVQPNTFGLNFTTNISATTYEAYRTFSTTPCVLQWQVPTPNATNYYYIEPWNPSAPRQIHVVSSDPNIPSTGTGSGAGSGSSSGSNNNSTGTATTAPPTTNGTTAPTGTGSLSPTPTGTGTGPSSSTGSKTPSSAFASAHLSGWTALPLIAALAAISTATAAAL